MSANVEKGKKVDPKKVDPKKGVTIKTEKGKDEKVDPKATKGPNATDKGE